MAGDRSVLIKRALAGAVILAAILFAVEGGEFGSLDLVRQRRTTANLNHSIDSLQRIVDSLKAYKNLVEHDPATQERIAREVFGMVRGQKELLYRFADSTSKNPPL